MVEKRKAPSYLQLTYLYHDWWKDKGYQLTYWEDFNFNFLHHVIVGKQWAKTVRCYNDVMIMADTETSRSGREGDINNHVVAWTISARAYGINLFTLYGSKPSDFCRCVDRMIENLPAHHTIIYFHNLSYDYVFLRKFMFESWGYPERQLNTKPHYPVSLEFNNGLIIRDSLILAQRSLEKWAFDMNVEHQKAVGSWDYDLIRNQGHKFTNEELHYIENDTLAGVECLDALRLQLGKKSWQMPYTATGIVREDVRKIGKANRAKDRFNSAAPDLEQYKMLEKVYHGGYTHANRHELNFINPAVCYDFASDYPYCLLAYKFPSERFMKMPDCPPEDVMKDADRYAYMFKLILVEPELKNDDIVMPALQLSKCETHINAICDNGRILKASYATVYLTEQDLAVILEQYVYTHARCVSVYAAEKDYLPRWLTDYVYTLFVDKTKLKGGDPVAYSLAKAKLNSVYGLTVQKWVRDDLQEDFYTGEYHPAEHDPVEQFTKYLENKNNILLYQIGVWVTAYAFRRIFELGKCISGEWLYSDTDSCYATEWDKNKLNDFNQRCKDLMVKNNYGAVRVNDRDYWLGVAELDGEYSEFVSCGAKRYACRDKDGKLKITVAGVPKQGVKCLHDDIRNFHKGLVFDGLTTGKLTHTYNFVEKIFIDENGNETGDSINLSPCDYLLDSVYAVDWQNIDIEEINLQIYE